MNNKNSFLKYMFAGVDTKVILAVSILFGFLGWITGKYDGAFWLYSLGAGLPFLWFIAGFVSWRKYSK